MAYIRPEITADASWQWAPATYTRPLYDSSDAAFPLGIGELASFQDTALAEMPNRAVNEGTLLGDSATVEVPTQPPFITQDAQWGSAEPYIRWPYNNDIISWQKGVVDQVATESVQFGDSIELEQSNRNALEPVAVRDFVSALNTRLLKFEDLAEPFMFYDWSARYYGFGVTAQDLASFSIDAFPTLNGLTIHARDVSEAVTLDFGNVSVNTKEGSALEGLGVATDVGAMQSYLETVTDRIMAGLLSSSRLQATEIILQTLKMKEKLSFAWLSMVNEDFEVGFSYEYAVQKATAVLEKVAIEAGFSAAIEFYPALAIALTCQDEAASGKGGYIAEALAASESAQSKAAFYSQALEQALLSLLPSNTGVITLPLSEVVEASEQTTASAFLSQLVQEGVVFEIPFNAEGRDYTGWVMNTETFAVSEYDSYPFNSFAKVDGKYYGTNEQGIYELSGDSDDGSPIEAFARLGLTDFGAETQKRLDSAYLGFRANGEMVLKIETEDGTERWYKVHGDNERLHRERIHPVGKGMRSVWWQFELANIDGADFEFEYIEFTPLVMARSV